MTCSRFVDEDPIIIEMLGQQILLFPTIRRTGLCVYQSESLELFVPTRDGKIRCNGKFVLKPYCAKHWNHK